LCNQTVEAGLGQIEPDDPVERGYRFSFEAVEHASADPLVTAGSQRGVGYLVMTRARASHAA